MERLCVPPFQIVTPPGCQVNPMPKGNLVIDILTYSDGCPSRGHPRQILPPLSHPQRLLADGVFYLRIDPSIHVWYHGQKAQAVDFEFDDVSSSPTKTYKKKKKHTFSFIYFSSRFRQEFWFSILVSFSILLQFLFSSSAWLLLCYLCPVRLYHVPFIKFFI